jgi:hypothetical protein
MAAEACCAVMEDAGHATEAGDDMRIEPPGQRAIVRHGAKV